MKYEELDQLGEGGSAVVCKAKCRKTGKIFAVKKMANRDFEKEMNSRAEFDLVKSIPKHTRKYRWCSRVYCNSKLDIFCDGISRW